LIRGILFDMRALVYGPSGADFLSEVLRGEGISVEPVEVTDALQRMPQELKGARTAMRTEEQENDYHRAMLPVLLEALGVADATDALVMRLVETVHQYSAYYSLYPEALSVLEELKQRGCTMAVVANWEPSLQRFIREFELEGYVTAAVSSLEVGVAKPDPYIFAQALKAAGLKEAETVHVGPDLTEDVTGAMAADIRPVWLNRTGIPTGHEVLSITDLRGLLLLVPKAGE
jgi:HAD superfamily hydrolase (TIGR01509 family)